MNDYTLDDLLEYTNFIPTASVVYRNQIVKELPEWFTQSKVGDFPLHILNLYTWGIERIGYIDEPMSVYRRHSGGVFSGRLLTDQLKLSVQTYRMLDEHLDLAKRPAWHKGMSKVYVNLCREYQAEGAKLQALHAGYSSVQNMPWSSKGNVMQQVFGILALPAKGPFIPIFTAFFVLLGEGPLAFANATIRKISKAMKKK